MKAFAPTCIPLCLIASLTVSLAPAAPAVDAKPGDAKAAESKASDGRPGDGKASDGKTSDGRAGTSGAAGVAQLNEEGAALYAARDYRRAIEKFIQAYAIDADPNLLFNIARCYEELGEVEAAIEKYETFLKTPGADTRGRQRARESLAALREAQHGDDGARAAAPLESAKPPETELAPASAPAAERGAGPLPWIVLGGAGAFALMGTTFYVLGASDHAKVTDARGYGDSTAVSDMTRREADDWVSSGNTKKLVGGISLGLAGALAATSVVLLVNADEDSPADLEPAPSIALSLAPVAGGASVLGFGSF